MNFAETFPSIATLEATLEIDGKGIQGLSQRMRLDVSNFRELITCANPRCHRGGFSIGDILRAMDVKKQVHVEDMAICRGTERRRGFKCMTIFPYRIDVSYK